MRLYRRLLKLKPALAFLRNLHLLTVYDLFKLQLAVFMYRHQNNLLPSLFRDYFITNASIHNYNTRSRFNIHHNSCNTNTKLHTVRFSGPKLWNSIDPSTRSINSLNSFKSAFKNICLKQLTLCKFYLVTYFTCDSHRFFLPFYCYYCWFLMMWG